ncbi:MAG: hypothetical protein R2911_41055 [Caldilineaceae bacterium]
MRPLVQAARYARLTGVDHHYRYLFVEAVDDETRLYGALSGCCRRATVEPLLVTTVE